MTPAFREESSVLVVEDNPDLCENLAEILGTRGYQVATAFTGRMGIESARERPPDVALIDLNLPDLRGIDALGEIRRLSPETACVILTGNATLETAIRALNEGAYAYLVKGGRIEEVMATVDRAAEKVRLERDKDRLERALREERNFSRAVISNAALGIAVNAPDGRFLVLNRQMEDLVGLPPADLTDADDLVRLGRDAEARARLRETLTGDRHPRGTVEVEIVRPDGQERIWKVSTSTVEDESGRPDAVVAVFADVTEERALQQKVLEASRLAAIGEMAARVAHEIRNPLAGIAGAIRVLSRGFETDPKREAFARELIMLVGRLNGFVEDLLVYARPLRVVKEVATLDAVMAPVRAVLGEHPVVRGVTIEVEDRLGRPLRVDRHHFAMALQNLVLNASQALKGKGLVRIVAAPGADGGVVVTVSDDGPGLPPELFPHQIFEAFATTRIEGTGLGLSTTKRIVEAHGGTISAGNRPEGGAEFEIRLPA